LEYLYARLDKGITVGISEKNYYDFLNTLVEKINTDNSDYSIRVISPNESFSTILEKVIKKTKGKYDNGVSGLDFKGGVIYPNYNLRTLDWNDYKLFRSHGKARSLKDETISHFVQTPKLSTYSLIGSSDENFELAKKISSYFINDLIERYLKSRIESGHWPTQCRNANEFVFNRNIGKSIDETGTKENFEIAYYQAIRVIAELLEKRQSNNERVEFSNNDAYCLAYSNYLKILVPEILSFLLPYRYSQYQLRNANINVSVLSNEAKFKNSECVFSDPYSEWSDDYKSTDGVINDGPVLVMEKRIGKISKI
jgi:hypothetical protein